jgi:hypothetical protein
MTLQGTIRGGMVVLDEPVQVPDGTKVSVFVPTADKKSDWRPADDPELRRKALAEILAIPDENPGDTFSAVDKDRVLYGDHE